MKNIALKSNLFRHISYPDSAQGWINDVYHPRISKICDRHDFISESQDGLSINSRIIKETEETGFGIYYYEETAEFYQPMSNGFYYVDIELFNPTDSSYEAYIRINDLIKADSLIIEPSKPQSIRLFTSVLDNFLTIKFLHGHSENHSDKLSEGKVFIKSLAITEIEQQNPNSQPTIFLASDSTVMDYDSSFYPQTGWGQMLPKYSTLTIDNHAIGGRSSKSFIEENRLDRILEAIRPGDFLFVQFGHNDATKARPNRYVAANDFTPYIEKYVEGCRIAGAQCVLVTPVARRNCDDHGTFKISFLDYRSKMFDIAKKYQLPLLDLGCASTAFLKTLTPEQSKSYYMWIEAGSYDNERYAEGLEDNTHLNKKGATVFAELLSRLIINYTTCSSLDVIKETLSTNHFDHTMSLESYSDFCNEC